ncbi:hypothetical protein ACFPT7_14495 [Acidicapsa dinghuensis]|uniref:Uncharacterized protein n=1 Tax=Acidicapsa dinghuensis TaxID=2218256 RepID=A0ABW1EGR1_9BACT|nr:hypothetical protein [Acidicapsa dinghuensis]
MERVEFLERIRFGEPNILAREYLMSDEAHAFSDIASYSLFRDKVQSLFQAVEHVAVVGSANWRYSLNPEKGQVAQSSTPLLLIPPE